MLFVVWWCCLYLFYLCYGMGVGGDGYFGVWYYVCGLFFW